MWHLNEMYWETYLSHKTNTQTVIFFFLTLGQDESLDKMG